MRFTHLRRRIVIGTLVTTTLVGAGLAALGAREPKVVVGKVEDTPRPTMSARRTAVPARPLGCAGREGEPFRGATDVPSDLFFFLIVGSDARPGERVTRARADSIHIAAVDPLVRKGTVLGLPRDSYADVPGYGARKINSALALGGPELLVRTLRQLTGLPIDYYAVTGFEGIVAVTDELGGVDVDVPYRMDDPLSGSRFEPERQHMNGTQVLAFTRDRHSGPGNDFTRSSNQGRLILAALGKLRDEVSEATGVRRWLEVLYRHAELDMPIVDAVDLGLLALRTLPADLTNIVAPGTPRSSGTVFIGDEACALFRDVGADALADGRAQRVTPPPTIGPSTSPGSTARQSPSPTPDIVPLDQP